MCPAHPDLCIINFDDERHDPVGVAGSRRRLVTRDLLDDSDDEAFADTIARHDVVAGAVKGTCVAVESPEAKRLPVRESAFPVLLDARGTAVAGHVNETRVVATPESGVTRLHATGDIAAGTGALVTGSILPSLACLSVGERVSGGSSFPSQ